MPLSAPRRRLLFAISSVIAAHVMLDYAAAIADFDHAFDLMPMLCLRHAAPGIFAVSLPDAAQDDNMLRHGCAIAQR